MAYRAEALDITIDASGNIAIPLSDFGGDTPKFVMAQSTKSTSDGNYQDDLFHSFGWGNLSQEDSAQMSSVDNVGTSVVIRSIQDNLFTAFDPSGEQALDGGTSVAAGNPATVNLALHGYSTGNLVAISGVASGGDINGVHTITKIDDDSFSIPVNNPTNRTGGKALLVTDQITLVSFSADEVVINVGIYGGTPYTVLFMVLGGSTLTDLKVMSFNLVTSAATAISIGISFLNGGGGASTITRAGDWSSTFFAGDIIEVSGSVSNDGFYTIVSVTATVITLATGVLTDESAGATVTISSGFIDVTGLGFDDVDAVMMFTSHNDNGIGPPPAIDINDKESAFSFGFFDVANGSQCTESHIYSDDNVATMNTHSVAGSDANCWSSFSLKSGVWTLRGELSFVSVIPDGFRLRQATGLSVPVLAHRINLVALKGGNYQCVQKTAPSSPGTQDIVNSGFTPSGMMSLFGLALARAAMSIGWASNKDGTKANTKEGATLVRDRGNVATSDSARLTKTDAFLLHDFLAPLDSVANIETWDPAGATLDFTAATAYVYHAIMFGDGTVTPSSIAPQVHHQRHHNLAL